jgi:hypothetical protein
MGKKEETEELNAFLAEESADDKETEAVNDLLERFSSTTKLLSALESVQSIDLEDEIGAALIKKFRVEFAKHELTTR